MEYKHSSFDAYDINMLLVSNMFGILNPHATKWDDKIEEQKREQLATGSFR